MHIWKLHTEERSIGLSDGDVPPQISGEIIASAGTQEGVVKAEIDLDMVKNIREEISLFKDRKEEAYV